MLCLCSFNRAIPGMSIIFYYFIIHLALFPSLLSYRFIVCLSVYLMLVGLLFLVSVPWWGIFEP